MPRTAGESVTVSRDANRRTSNTPSGVTPPVWVIAHRGASAFAPENTLAAFRRAVEMGAGFIETDLQLSRDVHLIAIHDETLDRTTNGRGAVSARSLNELRQLDAGCQFRSKRANGVASEGLGDERIPTLEE